MEKPHTSKLTPLSREQYLQERKTPSLCAARPPRSELLVAFHSRWSQDPRKGEFGEGGVRGVGIMRALQSWLCCCWEASDMGCGGARWKSAVQRLPGLLRYDPVIVSIA